MNVGLPGLDGFGVTRLMRESTELAAVPIFFISAYAEAFYRQTALAAGANEYLTKPLEFENLKSAIDRYLTR